MEVLYNQYNGELRSAVGPGQNAFIPPSYHHFGGAYRRSGELDRLDALMRDHRIVIDSTAHISS